MRYIAILLILIVIQSLQLNVGTSFADLKEGRPTKDVVSFKKISMAQVEFELNEHEKWIESNGETGDQANFSSCDLKNVYFKERTLSKIVMNNADLSKASFYGLSLENSVIRNSIFTGADFRNSNLTEAKAGKSSFSGAKMEKAIMIETRLHGAKFMDADLSEAMLDLSRLIEADLRNAVLRGASLVGTKLKGANLKGADLTGTNLKQANFENANLKEVVFEPKKGFLPDIHKIALARNLSQITYVHSAEALKELRKRFREADYTIQERELTFAIKHTQRIKEWREGGFIGKVESLFQLFLFELPCKYGLLPGRPLILMIIMIPIFSIFYFIILVKSNGDGIWKVWPEKRIRLDIGSKIPEKIHPIGFNKIGYSIYFSLLMAFRIGWRDFNIGVWISRLQKHKYDLIATGWTRTIAGLQSLFSIYMFALFILCYFGTPFD